MTPESLQIVLIGETRITGPRLQELLSARPGLVLSGQASDSQSALRLCQQVNPDVVLLAARLSDGTGLSVVGQLRQQLPLAIIIVFAESDLSYPRDKYLSEGANRVILTPRDLSDIADIIGEEISRK